MPTYEFIDQDENDYFDALFDAEFENLLDHTAIREVTQIIFELIDYVFHQHQMMYLLGLTKLAIDEQTLTVQLRFSRKKEDIKSDERTRKTVQFMFYLLAKVDQKYPLSKTPFPVDDVKVFLEVEDEWW